MAGGPFEKPADREPPALPERSYEIIYADPPWPYEKSGGMKSSRGLAKRHYRTMRLEEIMALPVGKLAAENCALWLWTTFPQYGAALEVIEAWGFTYFNAGLVWVKRNPATGKDAMGMGYWTRANPEACLLAFRGRMEPLRHDVRQLLYAPAGRHSEKPPEARERIVALCGDRPRIELFARQRAAGWDAWGDEVPEATVPLG